MSQIDSCQVLWQSNTRMSRAFLYVLWFPITFILLIASFYLIIKPKNTVSATLPHYILSSGNTLGAEITDNVKNTAPSQDIRLIALKRFLSSHNSPLYDYADVLVKTADETGLDYALIPAIAMQESHLCERIPYNSFNCWGFGIYGGKVTRFASYPEAIKTVATAIKKAYIKKGLVNVTLLEDLWTPPSRGDWSYGVNYYMNKIKENEQNLLTLDKPIIN